MNEFKSETFLTKLCELLDLIDNDIKKYEAQRRMRQIVASACFCYGSDESESKGIEAAFHAFCSTLCEVEKPPIEVTESMIRLFAKTFGLEIELNITATKLGNKEF